MPRIKKRGLDYFPMNTDFIQNRLVRRILKREGDAALAILLGTFSYIYADEGYYVVADDLFYDDLSTCLYEQTADDVRRVLALAVEYGIFNADLFARYSILTSAEIQRQYLFSTKRRKTSTIDARYCLSDDACPEEEEAQRKSTLPQPLTGPEESTDRQASAHCLPAESAATAAPDDRANVTFKPENVASGTHSIAQNSIAQNSKAQESIAEQRKEKPLHSSPENGGTEGADRASAEEAYPRKEENRPEAKSLGKDEEYRRKIAALQPPRDGQKRNLEGLLLNLRQFNIAPQEQYAIILRSNFGAIGHPMWKGFGTLRESHGKIRQPGRYLLSLC